MDHFKGITAEIISNGQVLNLYDDPDAAEVEDKFSRHHYVEAVAGSTFQVKVSLRPQFNISKLDAQHAASIQLKIDGSINTATHCTKRLLQYQFSMGQVGGYTFTGPKQFCKETGQWMLADYSFGNLVLNETSDPGFSVKQAQDLGRIQVIVQLVKIEQRKQAHNPNKEPIVTINEVPEKALKGRPIETTVKLANARPTSRPSLNTTKAKSIDGEAGKPVVFNIYYRSRRALQMMGCIPRSPSPESQILNDEAAASEDVAKEVRDLRARLDFLERGHNVKPEPSGATTRLKRERDEEGNEGSRQRRRTGVKIELVDLTGD